MKRWYIYKITNTVNGKVYIGKTGKNPPEYRWSAHKSNCKAGSILPLHRSMRKYGFDRFEFEIIDDLDTEEESYLAESFWISYHDSFGPSGYNCSIGGEGQSGWKHREESKSKMARPGNLNGMFGRGHTEEARKKISSATKLQFETKGHPWIGRRHSEETKKKISDSRKKLFSEKSDGLV